jgi:hypothetical protein
MTCTIAHTAIGIRLTYSSKIIGAFLASKCHKAGPLDLDSTVLTVREEELLA